MPVTVNLPPVIPSNVPDYPSNQTRQPGLLEKLRAVSRIQKCNVGLLGLFYLSFRFQIGHMLHVLSFRLGIHVSSRIGRVRENFRMGAKAGSHGFYQGQHISGFGGKSGHDYTPKSLKWQLAGSQAPAWEPGI